MTTDAYPLAWPEGWPRAKQRKSARFSKGERRYYSSGPGSYLSQRQLTIADATKRVTDELHTLGVPYGEAIISTNLELRLDGLPRSSQKEPDDPGVAVYWRRRRNEPTKVMAIDIYDRVADNLAAVAATLNAMRAIERHGGAQILERAFTGFTALPPPKSPWDILGIAPQADEDTIRNAYRRKAMEVHPDMPGGSADKMAELNRARADALTQIGAQ